METIEQPLDPEAPIRESNPSDISRLADLAVNQEEGAVRTALTLDRIEQEKLKFESGLPTRQKLARNLVHLAGKTHKTDPEWLDESMSRTAELHDHMQEAYTANLANVRDALHSLSPHDKDRLDKYLDENALSFMTNVKERFLKPAAEEGGSWVDWLAADAADLPGMTQEEHDAKLTNFLQWHVNSLIDEKNPSVEAKVKELKEEYKADIRRGVEEGWLDNHALTAIEAVDRTRVKIGDIFDTLVQGRGGYHRYGSSEVVVAQGHGSTKSEQSETVLKSLEFALKHELNHAVLGRAESRWLNEALTEHIARAFDVGFPDIVLPSARLERIGGNGDTVYGESVYEDERILLDTVLNHGEEKIPVVAFTRDYSSIAFGESYNASRTALERAWGYHDVLYWIGAKVQDYEVEFAAANPGSSLQTVQRMALHAVRSDLLQQPEAVFYQAEKFDSSEKPLVLT